MTDQRDEEIQSYCGHTIEDILNRRSEDDLRRLRSILTHEDPDPVQLQNAISLVGRWEDPEVAPDVIALLPRLDERGLINAIDSLGRLGGPRASDAIIAHATHESPDVRRFVVTALKRLDTAPALDLLTTLATSDPASFVRAKAAEVLDDPAGPVL